MADQVNEGYHDLKDRLTSVESISLFTIPSDVNGVMQQLEVLKVFIIQ